MSRATRRRHRRCFVVLHMRIVGLMSVVYREALKRHVLWSRDDARTW